MLGKVEFVVKGVDAPPEIEALRAELNRCAQTAGSPLQASSGVTAWNVLAVAVGSGGAVSVAARAIGAWALRRRRNGRSDVHVEVRDPNGVTVVVDVTDTDAVEQVLRQALAAVERPRARGRRGR